jgi:hypothetical protein
MSDLRNMPESYWKEKLTPQQYKVVRQKGTERAFTGALWNNHENGMYECVACGQPLSLQMPNLIRGRAGLALTVRLIGNTWNYTRTDRSL